MFCFWTLEGDFFGLGFESQKNRRLVSATKKKYLFGIVLNFFFDTQAIQITLAFCTINYNQLTL